jgi:hypothetical protein
MGDVSLIFPDGIQRLDELPHTLHTAILVGYHFIGFDELPDDERPPKRIWFDADEMRSWWSFVKRKREAEVKGESAESSHGQQNQAVKELIVG